MHLYLKAKAVIAAAMGALTAPRVRHDTRVKPRPAHPNHCPQCGIDCGTREFCSVEHCHEWHAG